MRGPNQVTSKSDVVAFINTASGRSNWPPVGRPAGVRSGHVQMSSPANAVESGKACGRALPLQELVGQSFFISRRRGGPASLTRPRRAGPDWAGPGRRKATRTQIRRSHAPTRRSIIFTRLLSGADDCTLDVLASWKPRGDSPRDGDTEALRTSNHSSTQYRTVNDVAALLLLNSDQLVSPCQLQLN